VGRRERAESGGVLKSTSCPPVRANPRKRPVARGSRADSCVHCGGRAVTFGLSAGDAVVVRGAGPKSAEQELQPTAAVRQERMRERHGHSMLMVACCLFHLVLASLDGTRPRGSLGGSALCGVQAYQVARLVRPDECCRLALRGGGKAESDASDSESVPDVDGEGGYGDEDSDDDDDGDNDSTASGGGVGLGGTGVVEDSYVSRWERACV